jgi:hypothetical protein
MLKQNNKKFLDGKFGRNLFALYNNIEITYILEDVSLYEAFLLKRFASRTTRLSNLQFLKEYTEITGAPKKFTAFVYALQHDEKIPYTPEKHDYCHLYGPTYFIHGDMTITLTGGDLVKLFDMDPTPFFQAASDGKCVQFVGEGEIKVPELLPFKFEPSMITKTLIDLFLDRFQRDSVEFISRVDMFTDIANHNFFSNHDTLIRLAYMKNPYAKLNFKGSHWKATLSEAPAELKKHKKSFDENTYLTFEVYSHFSTFLDLYDKLPKRMFILIEDVKAAAQFQEIYIPSIFDDFKEHFTKRYEELNEYIQSIADFPYLRYQYTYLNAPIAYSIELSLYEFNVYIAPLMEEKVLKSQSQDVCRSMIKFAKSIYNYIF